MALRSRSRWTWSQTTETEVVAFVQNSPVVTVLCTVVVVAAVQTAPGCTVVAAVEASDDVAVVAAKGHVAGRVDQTWTEPLELRLADLEAVGILDTAARRTDSHCPSFVEVSRSRTVLVDTTADSVWTLQDLVAEVG